MWDVLLVRYNNNVFIYKYFIIFFIDEQSQKRSTSPTEIKILTPYDSPLSPPPLIASTCCDGEEDRCSSSGHQHEDDDVIIPSPLGYNELRHLHEEPRKFYPPGHYHVNRYSFAPPSAMTTLQNNRYMTSWSINSLDDVKKHQCEYCLKWFQRSSSLSNHRLIHKNSKTFKCNQCNMSFLRKSDLGKHMVTHSGNKPYQCNVCGKHFSQSSNMLTHQRRHTGIRPYSCGICGKAFYRKVDVRRHASVHRDY